MASAKTTKTPSKTTKKSTEKEVKKTTTTKKSATKSTPKEVKTQDVNVVAQDDKIIQTLQDEIAKIKAELELIKAFNKKTNEGGSDEKVYKEIESIKEMLYDINERFEELEYQYGNLNTEY